MKMKDYNGVVNVDIYVFGEDAGVYRTKCSSSRYLFKDEKAAVVFAEYITEGRRDAFATDVYTDTLAGTIERFQNEGLEFPESRKRFIDRFQAYTDAFEDGKEALAFLNEYHGCMCAYEKTLAANPGVKVELPEYVKDCYMGFREITKAILENAGCMELKNPKIMSKREAGIPVI